MRRILTLAVIIAITAAGLSAFFISKRAPENIFCFLDIGTHHPPTDFIELNDSVKIGQSFTPGFQNMFRLSVFILKDKDDINPDAELVFHLRHKDALKDIVTKSVLVKEIRPERRGFYQMPPDPEIKGGFHYHIQFPVITDSKDREFYLCLESHGLKEGEGLKIGLWKKRYYEALREGKMFINDKEEFGFLAFRTFHTWTGAARILFDEVKERLFKDKAFLIFYSGLIILTITGILLTVRIK